MCKVCHITSAHSRYDGRILERECASLANHGFQVALLVNDDKQDELWNGISIHSTKKNISNRLARLVSLSAIYEKALEIDAKLYHLHDPELLLLGHKLKKAGKNVIFDSHEFYSEQIKSREYLPRFLRGIIAKYYYKYETRVCKELDGVICIEPTLIKDGKEFKQFEGRCKRVAYVGNYPRYMSVGRPSVSKEFAVCYAGGLSYERGISHLIEACYLANCKLILAGPFSPQKYSDELKKKKSYSCVDYRGVCTREEVYQIYAEAGIGAVTYLDQGQHFMSNSFATKVYEYFQLRMPVIISNYPYAIQMNEQYHYGITVAPDDPKAIADAIIYLKEHNDEARAMGENGYKLYKEQFNWEQEERQLLKLYEIILKE